MVKNGLEAIEKRINNLKNRIGFKTKGMLDGIPVHDTLKPWVATSSPCLLFNVI
ncbi:MAG: hypothetical protein JW927_06980 [Deltaproteobacteria bacterium]|nr:hypothetical protein [Deltaproteobacteria bacterium]